MGKVDYLIIGNSAAGISAAEEIRKHDMSGSILICSNEPYAAYGRPLISYVVEGKASSDGIFLKEPGFYENLKIDTLLGPAYEVIGLEADKHVAHLACGDEIPFIKCLVATGSVPFLPPISGLTEAKNAFRFMTIDDALKAWEYAVRATSEAHESHRKSTCLVIGAGLIGLKAAEALSYHVDEVLVLELAPRILPAVLDDRAAKMLQDQLLDRNIKCLPGISADRIVVEDGFATKAILTDGSEIGVDLVIAAVGVRPNSKIAVDAGAFAERGLVCDSRLQTSLVDVYAAGDVVQVTDRLDGSKHPFALWPSAVQQGKVAGQNMCDALKEDQCEKYESDFAVNAVDFFDISLLTSGMIVPPENFEGEVKTQVAGNSYAKFVMRDNRLVGYILLNRPDNAGIYTDLIDSGTSLASLNPEIFDAVPRNLDFPDEQQWERLHKLYPSNRDRFGWVVKELS